ncbi:MAG: hypothetical protein ACLQO6_05545 [Desulfomonilaceae bacterium]
MASLAAEFIGSFPVGWSEQIPAIASPTHLWRLWPTATFTPSITVLFNRLNKTF